jgi:cytochrome o ubiquinol oxidase subunit 1
LPEVSGRDAFWEMKRSGKVNEAPVYQDIRLPRNTPVGLIIAGFTFMFGFAVIWHIWWLAIAGLLAAIITIIVRSANEETEYTLKAAQVEKLETEAAARSYA